MKQKPTGPSLTLKAKHVIAATGDTFVILRARLNSGKFRRFKIEKAKLADLPSLYKYLVNKDVDLPLDYSSAKPYLLALGAENILKSTKVVFRCGFHGNTYVTPHGNYGTKTALKLQELPEVRSDIPLGQTNGTLQGYLAVVRPVALRSRTFRVLAGAQVLSILAGKIDIGQAGAIMVSGPSGLGKSAMFRLVTAMVGRAREDEDLKTWSGSEAGLEDYLAFYCHSLSVQDELGADEDDDPKLLLSKIRKRIMRFSTKQGRLLSTAYRKMTGVRQPTWNQYLVISSEVGLPSIAFNANKMIPAGVLRRCLLLHKRKGQAMCDISVKGEQPLSGAQSLALIVSAAEGVQSHYGVALAPLVEWINAKVGLEKSFRKQERKFILAMDPKDGWEHAFVRKFAAICAGGVMGIRAGVIPCQEAPYIASIRAACRASMAAAKAPPDEIVALASRLLKRIAKSNLVAKPNLKGTIPHFDVRKHWGFVSRDKKVKNILASRIGEMTGDQRVTSVLMTYLSAQKKVLAAKSHPVDVPGSGGVQHRCYRFRNGPK